MDVVNNYLSTLKVGSKILAERELSELVGIPKTTLRDHLNILAARGILLKHHGKPTVYLRDVLSTEEHY